MIIDVTVTLLTATATATAVNDIAVTVVLNDEVVNPEETFCERVDDCLDIPSANGNYVLKILSGVKSWVAESAGGGVWGSITGTITNQTDLVNYITTRLTGYATEAFVTTQGYITNVVTALGYTPEDVANKTDTMSGNTTSSDKYLSSKGVYDWVNSVNGNIIIGSWSGVDTFTGSTATTAFTGSSILVPANTYSVGDNVNFTLTGYRNSGGAAAVTVRVYVNTSNSLTGASTIGESNPTTGIQIIGLERRHINIKSATETNIGISGTGIDLFISSGTYTKAVLNIDWTIDQYIIPAIRLINGADSFTLLKFTVLKS